MIKPYDHFDPSSDEADEVFYPKVLIDTEDSKVILQNAHTITYEARCQKCGDWILEEELESFDPYILFDNGPFLCNTCKLKVHYNSFYPQYKQQEKGYESD